MKNLTQGFSNHCKLLMALLQNGVFNKCTVADQTRFELCTFQIQVCSRMFCIVVLGVVVQHLVKTLPEYEIKNDKELT